MSPSDRHERPPDALPIRSGERVLVVCAHPDDESFGLGAIVAGMTAAGAKVHVLCLTRGEASTLREHARDDLGPIREAELAAAGGALGIAGSTLLDHPDGGLAQVATDRLLRDVSAIADEVRPDLLLVFGPSGVTGHPDHRRATEAALRLGAAEDVPVLGWVLPNTVAHRLNEETGAAFVGVAAEHVDLVIRVDRRAQERAIACHRSQERDNPVLRRRLELLGDREHLVWLRRR